MSVGVSGVNHLIGHILMMQMDSFTFRVLIRYLELISVPNQSKDKTISYNSKLYPRVGRLLVSVGVSGVNHLIGHILMMQMDSFNFGF